MDNLRQEYVNMNLKEVGTISILIHHHTIAYEQDGSIWIQSPIGVWVDELSKYFGKIGLLLFLSDRRHKFQDYQIRNENIRIHSLGQAGQKNRLLRNLKAKNICSKVSQNYQCTIIRGITPRQLLVYKSSTTRLKVFYFVGSLIDSKPRLSLDLVSFIQRFMFHVHRMGMRTIFKTSAILTNSPGTVKEIERIFGKQALFAPTNTLSERYYSYQPYYNQEDIVRLLYCGRIAKDKGIEDLLLAVRFYEIEKLNAS